MTGLHSRRLGRPGGQPALLAHCFLGHGGSWKALVEALPGKLDALAPDLPGHGRSPMPEGPGDFHALTAEALGALVERPSLLIGHSFGAASLLRFALANPARVKGLVLIEPVLVAAAEGAPEHADYCRAEAPMQAAIEAGDLAGAARIFLAMNPGSPEYDALPEPARRAMAAQMRLVAAARDGVFGDSGGLLRPGLMEGFAPPVLLVTGARTVPVFHAVVRGLTRRLPNAESAVIPGAGHMLPVTDPQATAGAIHGWMRRHGLAGDALASETENPRAG